jgi:hypothetical protein
MKHSLEKSRSINRRPPTWSNDVRKIIPCNPAAVDMGRSWGSPPVNWENSTQSCHSCRVSFEVTASEKQYWYETLRIPFSVAIVYCPACRKRNRAQRRIANRLAELAPLVESGEADGALLREFVLVIAEGTVRRARSRNETEDWVLSGIPILLKGCEVINRLMKVNRPQADLLPILLHFHQRLKNGERVKRITAQIERCRQDRPKLIKAMEAIDGWLKDPSKRRLERIIKSPRL